MAIVSRFSVSLALCVAEGIEELAMQINYSWLTILGLLASSLTFGVTTATAQRVIDADKIEQSLRPPARTRSLRGVSPPAPEVVARIKKLNRGITIEDRVELSAAVATGSVAAIDLEVLFAYNSADLSPTAASQLMQLGRALTATSLSGSTFAIAGHTDAAGGREYNQRLSERRAASVKLFLTANFSIPEAKLIVIGYGQEQLKDTADPYGQINRRVQVLSLGR